MSKEYVSRQEVRERLNAKLHFYKNVRAVPVVIKYGDTIWKKGWFKYSLVDCPDGGNYCDEAVLVEPTLKSKRGQMVTVNRHGEAHHGVGFVAANLTQVDGVSLLDSLKLIFDADPEVAGIAMLNENEVVMDWIDREHASYV